MTEAAADEQAHRTPLAIKLDEFGDTLTKAIGIICVGVWAASIPKFHDPTFKTPMEGAVYYAKVVSLYFLRRGVFFRLSLVSFNIYPAFSFRFSPIRPWRWVWPPYPRACLQ